MLNRLATVGFTTLMLGCTASSARAPVQSAATAAQARDADGVQQLFPSAPGVDFRLSTGDPNATSRFLIERGTRATPGIDGAVRFWNVASHALNYSSGGTGFTSRLHIQGSGTTQRFTWRTQQGFLSDANDLRNQEFTVFARVHGRTDLARAMVTMKVRGGGHSAGNGDLASCVMLTLAPKDAPGGVTRFGKELTHPDYDYVRVTPKFAASLVENVWVGIKMLSWNDPANQKHVINRLYLDTDPFDRTTGRPRNNWRLFSEYIDVDGKSSGQYNTLVNWGGWQTTVRADGYHDIDFALLSAREIVPPRE